MRRRVTEGERRARVGRAHRLGVGAQADDVVTVAGELCGLHATDPVSVFLSARARVRGFEVGDLEGALYDERTAVRMLGMRRTMFVVPVGQAAVVHQACTVKVAATLRKRFVAMVEEQGVAKSGTRWLAKVERDVVDVLVDGGDALAAELSARVPALATKVALSEGKTYGREVALNNQVLTLLAAEGRIVRGRPKGRWTTNQYRWAPIDRWIEPGALEAITPAEAEAALARRWLGTYGPATEADLRWWAGWTATQARRALATIGAVEVDLDEGVGWLLPADLDALDDDGTNETDGPWVALLPALDPAAMGWQGRAWYLGPHAATVTDRTGNIGATVWVDGRVVGGWAAPRPGEVVTRLLDDVGREASTEVDAAAASLAAWLDGVTFKPRFPSPLDRELAG